MDRLKDLWLIFLSLSRGKKVVVALGVYMFIAVVSGVVGNLTSPSGPSQPMVTYSDAKLDPYKDRSELDSPTPTTWHDSDLVEWTEDPDLAYTSFEVSSSQCGYGGCLGIIVQTQSGCSNTMYAEIELLDGSDINIGYSNDLIGRVSPGKKAKLIFHLSDSDIMQAKNWNVTKISCY
jgi:hypothetical protein